MSRRTQRLATAALAGLLAIAAGPASALQAMDDSQLASVRGSDGLAFNLQGFSLTPASGQTTTLTYAMPDSTAGNLRTLTIGNFSLSRTDDPSPFTDPYTLTIVPRLGFSDVISLSMPQNSGLTQLWNFNGDLGVTSNGLSHDLGNFELKGLGFQGGGLNMTTPSIPGVEGVAFGLSLKLNLAELNIRPRGFADSSEMLSIRGLRIADANTGGVWSISDVDKQPAIFNAITDSSGSSLHFQIGWATGTNVAPTAAVNVDRIVFQSNGVTTDLGSSRIGGVQINFMDVRLRPGT